VAPQITSQRLADRATKPPSSPPEQGLHPRTRFAQAFVRAEHGAAAVEVAITSGILFMTLIGLMKICLAIYTYHFVSEAAREGTRYAIVRGSACGTPFPSFTTACPAKVDGSDVNAYVKGLSYPGISSAAMTVTTTYSTYPATKVCNPLPTCNNPSDLVTVKVDYAFPLSLPYIPANSLFVQWHLDTYTMTSTSAMIIAQ